jgi:hypothetical protein
VIVELLGDLDVEATLRSAGLGDQDLISLRRRLGVG